MSLQIGSILTSHIAVASVFAGTDSFQEFLFTFTSLFLIPTALLYTFLLVLMESGTPPFHIDQIHGFRQSIGRWLGDLLLTFNSYSEEFIYVLENYNKPSILFYPASNKQKQKPKENRFLLFFHPLLYTSHQKLPLFTSDKIIRHHLFVFFFLF